MLGRTRMKVWIVQLESYPRHHRYVVKANGENYDEFVSKKKLRRDDMKDIADGYASVLDWYRSPVV